MGKDTDDGAIQALVELRAGLDHTIAELGRAAARADQLIELRRGGSSWYDIVTSEEPPLVIETITRVLDELGELGSRFRREEARARQRENRSQTKIGWGLRGRPPRRARWTRRELGAGRDLTRTYNPSLLNRPVHPPQLAPHLADVARGGEAEHAESADEVLPRHPRFARQAARWQQPREPVPIGRTGDG